MDLNRYQREAWDEQVAQGNPWTQPVSPEAVAAARRGEWSVVVTPNRPVPREWFGDVAGQRILALAGGGGQQGPVLAAAGADVTVFDQSPAQLEQDRRVAEREKLALRTVQGDMADLSAFADDSFDLVLNPCSICFAASTEPVWREVARVLRPQGVLITGVVKPLRYLFDPVAASAGRLEVRFELPYSDLHSISEAERQQYVDAGEPFVFGHTLEDLLGGQMAAGLAVTALFEDGDSDPADLLSRYAPSYLATRAVLLGPTTTSP